MKIYTRTGDGGSTTLFDGTRIAKSDPRVDAYGRGRRSQRRARRGTAPRGSIADIDAMMDTVQRDLFALGSRLADPAERIADRVTKDALGPDDVARLEGWIDNYEDELAAASALHPARGHAGGLALHLARTVCRRAERRMVALVSVEVCTRLHEPAVRSAVRAGARRQQAGRRGRGRVVTHRRGLCGVRTPGPVALRELPGRVGPAAARGCGRTSRRSTRSHAPPTTSPTKGRAAAERLAQLDDWLAQLHACRRRATAPRAAAATLPEPGRPWRRSFVGAGRDDSSPRPAGLAVRRSRQRIQAGRRDEAVRVLGRAAGLLPAVGQSGRPPGPPGCRLRGRRPRPRVGCGLHRVAVDQLLAGRRARLAEGAGLRAARKTAGVVARDEQTSRRRSWTPAWRLSWREMAAGRGRCSTQGRPVCDGVSGRLRYELRITWLGGRRILDALEPRGSMCLNRARAWGGGRPGAGVAGGDVAVRPRALAASVAGDFGPRIGASVMASRDTNFYYSFVVLPAEKREAIIAVWDFFRAVDDAVDEAGGQTRRNRAPPPPRRSRRGGGNSRRCYGEGGPVTPEGLALVPHVGRFGPAAARRSRTSSTASRWTWRAPVGHLRGPAAGTACAWRRPSAWSASRSSATATRLPPVRPRPRRRAPVDEHPQGPGEGPSRAAGSTCPRRTSRGSA